MARQFTCGLPTALILAELNFQIGEVQRKRSLKLNEAINRHHKSNYSYAYSVFNILCNSMNLDKEIKFLERWTLSIPIGGLILCFILLFISTGCSGTWVWQEDYPKHRTMSFKCPRWNYNEAYDELHHIYATRQHERIKINDKRPSK